MLLYVNCDSIIDSIIIVFGSQAQRTKLKDILNNLLRSASAVRNLGVLMGNEFSFTAHVQSICKGCFAQLRNFRRFRRYLTNESAVIVANAFEICYISLVLQETIWL